MGSVYMCRLTGSAGFRRLFAMKVLHSHLASDSDSLEAFFHEARVLGGMHHPNIVGIVDVGNPSEPYIVLDYVEGGNLVELYRATRESRNPALVVAVVLDALSGLATAHNARDENDEPLRLVHDDVTPHNLLVGVDGTCRVTDFGIARTSHAAAEDIMRGKPSYLAPERLRKEPSDHRSDVFSMGVVLYSGLTGVDPFTGETPDDTMRNVLNAAVQPPSEVGLRPPPCLDWVCMKALARDPSERFQSAEEMATQLRRIAAREGLLASSSEVAEWVKTALAPTLAARRAASQRGTLTAGARKRKSIAPPRVELSSAPPESPSSAEITGPISAPPSSRSFDDRTEILDSTISNSQKIRSAVVYLALAAAMIALVWVVLRPDAVASFFRRTPSAHHIPATQIRKETEAAESQNQGETERDSAESEVNIPEIAPNHMNP